MSTIRKSLVLSFAQRYGELALRLLSMVALARLLTPAEIGMFTVGAAAIGIALVLAEFGLQAYLIKQIELSANLQRAVFGVAVVLALAVAAFAFAASRLLTAHGLIDPRLAELLAILSLTILLQPLQAPFGALLQREMMFGALLVIGMAKTITLVASAILLAWAGFGAASLAWGSVAEAVAGVLAISICRRTMPWTLPSRRGWPPILNFGAVATAIAALKQLGDAIPSVAIGHVLGFGSAGLFSRAQGIVGLFDRGVMQAISPIVLPMLVAARRDGRDLKAIYEVKIAYLSGIAWPFFIFVGVMADPIVALLLGDQWLPAASVVRILAVAGLLLPFNNMNLQFFTALDMQTRYLRIQAMIQGAKVTFIVGLCFTGSLDAVAIAVLGERLLKLALTYRPLKERLGFGDGGLVSVLKSSALVTIAASAAPIAVVSTMGLRPDNSLLALAIALVGAGGAWLVGLLLVSHPLRAELARGAGRIRALVQPTG